MADGLLLTPFSAVHIMVPYEMKVIWYTGWMLHLVQLGRDWGVGPPTKFPPCCTKYNSPPVKVWCTNCDC